MNNSDQEIKQPSKQQEPICPVASKMRNGHMLKKSIITSQAAETHGACGKPFRPSLTTSPRHITVKMTHPSQMHSTTFIHGLKCRTTRLHKTAHNSQRLSPADVRKTLSRINPCKACGSWQHTWPCTEGLCWTADRYLQHLAEPGSHPHMSQIHDNHTGTK